MNRNLLKDKSYTLGTHQPIIRSVMETFDVKGVLELGTGLKSTQLFVDYNKEHISVETDNEWYGQVKSSVKERDGYKIHLHDIGHGVGTKTKWHELTEDVIKECMQYYRNLIAGKNINVLFVDHVSGLRIFTTKEFLEDKSMDVIMYHDAQHEGYGFNKLNKSITDGYVHLMFKSLGVYTGILIKEELFTQEAKVLFDMKAKEYGTQYASNFNIQYKHVFEEL
jgi:hypothetical protein